MKPDLARALSLAPYAVALAVLLSSCGPWIAALGLPLVAVLCIGRGPRFPRP